MSSENLDLTLITAIVGAVCGVLGAVLGVINTWHQIQTNKVRLKVTPQFVFPVGPLEGSEINFGIDVINQSGFPLTIVDVGLNLSDGRKIPIVASVSCDIPSQLPIRLESRSSYSKMFNILSLDDHLAQVVSAYARTGCGVVETGTSGALKQLVRESK
jgi:hypothetical protein